MSQLPELLSPAGSLEKLKIAVSYGADAVYLGGQKFGLRSAAENFTNDELLEGVNFAHDKNSKVYVVLNSFLHDEDLKELPEFIKYLEKIDVDAVIVSDLGVVETIKEHTDLEVHLSTQASCLNQYSAKIWKDLGITRVVLGREASLKDAVSIKRYAGVEIEMFIHGSMCMAYSGNCVISNYTQGRDSNRGGCAHSCRFEYSLEDSEGLKVENTFFMSSKDLNGIMLLDQFSQSKIDSIKVEGRMKSYHYVATVTKAYRNAIDSLNDKSNWKNLNKELEKVTHRSYTDASLISKAGSDSVYDEREHEDSEYTVVGLVREVIEGEYLLLEVRSKFHVGDTLELVPFKENSFEFVCEFLVDMTESKLDSSKPGTLVKIPYVKNCSVWNIVRKRNR